MSTPLALTRRTALHGFAAVALGVAAIGRNFASAARIDGPAAAPGVYVGRPSLQTMLAMVLAGGGTNDFKTLTLFGALAGSRANAAVATLTKHVGAPAVKAFIITFDFFVADALRLLEQNGMRLPATPEPDPSDGQALLAALHTAGVDPATGRYTVEYMLDRLVSHRLNVRITNDIDAKYGDGAAGSFRPALRAMLKDLGAAREPYAL